MLGESDNPPFTLMISVSLHLTYSLSLRVRLFFSLSFLCMYKVEVVREVSGSVRVNMHSVSEVFFRADVHFKSKPSKLVGKED